MARHQGPSNFEPCTLGFRSVSTLDHANKARDSTIMCSACFKGHVLSPWCFRHEPAHRSERCSGTCIVWPAWICHNAEHEFGPHKTHKISLRLSCSFLLRSIDARVCRRLASRGQSARDRRVPGPGKVAHVRALRGSSTGALERRAAPAALTEARARDAVPSGARALRACARARERERGQASPQFGCCVCLRSV